MNKNILLFFLLVCISHIVFWFQVNGQFLWDFPKKYPFIVAFLGVPSSYLAIMASKFAYDDFGGKIWPMRIIGFSTGTIIFAFLAWGFMSEGLTIKTILCLMLSITIIIVQIAL
jgi:hypothetical protein